MPMGHESTHVLLYSILPSLHDWQFYGESEHSLQLSSHLKHVKPFLYVPKGH